MSVQRPSPESETRPANSLSSGLSCERRRGQVEQPRGDDAAAPPHLGDVAQVEVVLVELGFAQRRGLGVDGALALADVGVAEDVEPLGVRGHDAVLDAVVDHLDEVAGAAAARSAGSRARRVAGSPSRPGVRGAASTDGASAAKIGSSRCTTSRVAADHLAVAALLAPDAARGADVDVVDAVAQRAPWRAGCRHGSRSCRRR